MAKMLTSSSAMTTLTCIVSRTHSPHRTSNCPRLEHFLQSLAAVQETRTPVEVTS